jgi:hypothetical protein
MQISAPLLPRETVQKILELIRHDVAEDKVRIDTPTQNLESYFLGVVQKARQSEETSGATSGNRVAAYLRGDADQAASQADKILERLTLPAASAVTPRVEKAEPVETVDHKKLEELTKHQNERVAASTAPMPDEKAELEKANEKLSSLLGKK